MIRVDGQPFPLIGKGDLARVSDERWRWNHDDALNDATWAARRAYHAIIRHDRMYKCVDEINVARSSRIAGGTHACQSTDGRQVHYDGVEVGKGSSPCVVVEEDRMLLERTEWSWEHPSKHNSMAWVICARSSWPC